MATKSGGSTAAAAAAAAAAVTKNGGGGGGDLTFRPSPAEKKELEKEARSQRDNLTSSDRHLLKAFFSYVPVFTAKNEGRTSATRTRNDAITYVQTALWPSGLTQEQRDKEEAAFILEKLLQPAVPSVFVHTVESLRALFREGARMNDIQQGRLIRMFQHFDRLFTRDLAVRSTGFARVFVSGSVRIAVVVLLKRTYTDVHYLHLRAKVFFSFSVRGREKKRKSATRQKKHWKTFSAVLFFLFFLFFYFCFLSCSLFFCLVLFYEEKNKNKK